MKSYRKELWFNIPARRKIVRITEDVQKAIDESGIKEGLVLVNAMNITASVSRADFTATTSAGLKSSLPKSPTASTLTTALRTTPTLTSSAP